MILMRELLTLPNMLTSFRIVCVPVLLFLAWQGRETAFLVLLAAAFLSDALDGLAARLTGQVSPFGARLDSRADVSLFVTLTVSVWWLWPEKFRTQSVYILLIMVCYLLPALIGYLKFRAFTSYHTWLVKCAVAATGLTLYLLFLDGPAWPFRLATAVCVLAAIEEIAITAVSDGLHSDVRSLCDVLQQWQRKK